MTEEEKKCELDDLIDELDYGEAVKNLELEQLAELGFTHTLSVMKNMTSVALVNTLSVAHEKLAANQN